MNIDDISVDHLCQRGVPVHTAEALYGYLRFNHSVGSFLQAVLSNDLMGAMANADDENAKALQHIIRWLYTYAPTSVYGSTDKYLAWISQKGEAHAAGREQNT